MKKKLLICLLVITALLVLTGCNQEKNNDANVASTLTCTKGKKKFVVKFDKKDKIIEVEETTTYKTIEEAEKAYDEIAKGVAEGTHSGADMKGTKLVSKYKITSPELDDLGSSKKDRNKENYLKYAKDQGYKCK